MVSTQAQTSNKIKNTKQMEEWRLGWRKAIGIRLPFKGLLALRTALVNDSKALTQGTTADTAVGDQYKVGAACAIAYGLWKGRNIKEISKLKKAFNEFTCDGVDDNTEAMIEDFIDWFDNELRENVLKQLLPEVNRSIRLRVDKLSKRSHKKQ